MLRTNSKKARQNVRDYIKAYAADYMRDDYDADFSTDRELCALIGRAFEKEYCFKNHLIMYKYNYFEIFKAWASGLPIGGLFCYYWNRSAHDDLAAILEETPAEAARYTEEQARDCLTLLIFRECWEA